jgi:hypothetical protein
VLPGGRVIVLAQLSFLASQERHSLFDQYCSYVFAFSQRPSIPPGEELLRHGEAIRGSGSRDYVWAVFDPRQPARLSKLAYAATAAAIGIRLKSASDQPYVGRLSDRPSLSISCRHRNQSLQTGDWLGGPVMGSTGASGDPRGAERPEARRYRTPARPIPKFEDREFPTSRDHGFTAPRREGVGVGPGTVPASWPRPHVPGTRAPRVRPSPGVPGRSVQATPGGFSRRGDCDWTCRSAISRTVPSARTRWPGRGQLDSRPRPCRPGSSPGSPSSRTPQGGRGRG